jgi:ribokinase
MAKPARNPRPHPAAAAASPSVIVVGSLNLDYIASVDRLPVPGQTVAASGLLIRFGGKGANQAVAAARQGAAVAMIGCVGADDGGRAYRARLHAESIHAAGVRSVRGAPTGTALIAVDRQAENLIVVAPGANGTLTPAHVRAQRHLLKSARMLLMQLEIPLPAVVETLKIANRARVPVALNFSPLREGFPWGDAELQALLVNGLEAEHIFGLRLENLEKQLPQWRAALKQKRVAQLIITRGRKSTLCVTAQAFLEVPTVKVKPVDTVGAGDAFAGTFVAARAEGEDLGAAILRANCAGALATLKSGAQESIPTRAATFAALRRNRKVRGRR